MSYKNKRWEDNLPEDESVQERKQSLDKEIEKVKIKFAPGFIDDMNILFGRGLYYRIMRGIRNVRNIPREVKWFIQRGRRGYSEQDVWSMHSYLSSVIPPMLRDLAEIASGHPCNAFDSIGCEFHVLDDKHGTKGTENWSNLLRDIAKKLEFAEKIDNMEFMEDKDGNDIDDPKVWMPIREEWAKELNSGFELLGKWWFALWD